MTSGAVGQSGIEQIELQTRLSQAGRFDQYAANESANFKELLVARGSESIDTANMTDEQKIKLAAQQLVATTLIKPIMASVRQDPFKTDLFHGGRTEEAFGEQLDTLMADRMVKKEGFGLVDSVYKHFMQTIEKQAAAGQQQGIDLHG